MPYEVFKAPDAYITLGVANNSLWERMLPRRSSAPT